ncbi:hypothetical protein OYC64_011539 [Pagothenia borchgrevinki]|uniref:Uncharacterized protein n=1 Tax=Pagothenia borchgrevinki TaxID=8213 RepID=A0ABD2FG90_PAGBO
MPSFPSKKLPWQKLPWQKLPWQKLPWQKLPWQEFPGQPRYLPKFMNKRQQPNLIDYETVAQGVASQMASNGYSTNGDERGYGYELAQVQSSNGRGDTEGSSKTAFN